MTLDPNWLAEKLATAMTNQATLWLGEKQQNVISGMHFKACEELFQVALHVGVSEGPDDEIEHIDEEVEVAIQDDWRPRKFPSSIQTAWIKKSRSSWDIFESDMNQRFNAGSIDVLLKVGPQLVWTELKRESDKSIAGKNILGTFDDIEKLGKMHVGATRHFYELPPVNSSQSKVDQIRRQIGGLSATAIDEPMFGVAIGICNCGQGQNLKKRLLDLIDKNNATGRFDSCLVSEPSRFCMNNFSLVLCLIPLSIT